MSWSQFSADMAEARYHEAEDTGTDIPEDFRPLRTKTWDKVTNVIVERKSTLVPWLDFEIKMGTDYRRLDN